MKKKMTMMLLCAFFVFIIFGVVIMSFRPSKDSVQTDFTPNAFRIINTENYIDSQSDGQCSAYAAAYVMRHLGQEVTGEKLYPTIHRTFGFVSPKSVEKLFQEYEYYAKAYYGDINTLKKRLSEGVPVIAFIRIPNDTHYVVIVGYDEQYIYLADSLFENATVSGEWYNRKISTSEFLRVWKTNTLLPGNTYIIAAPKGSSH